MLSEPAVISRNGLFLTGLLADTEAVLSGCSRGGISVGEVPADASDLGEPVLWDPCFSMFAHRPNLAYDAVAWWKRLPP